MAGVRVGAVLYKLFCILRAESYRIKIGRGVTLFIAFVPVERELGWWAMSQNSVHKTTMFDEKEVNRNGLKPTSICLPI